MQKCLQVHLKVSDGGKHHRMNFLRRQVFYLEQVRKNNCELLCADCHAQRERNLRRSSAFSCQIL